MGVTRMVILDHGGIPLSTMMRRPVKTSNHTCTDHDRTNVRVSLSKSKKRPLHLPSRPLLASVLSVVGVVGWWFLARPILSPPSPASAPPSVTVDMIRQEFYQRYGGREAADAIYQRGVQAFGSLEHTAERLVRAAARSEPWLLSFAGYSVTVGRGNHYHQSFPFVLERILQPVLASALNVKVQVRNAAIGGIPSFPYGFCFPHFLGEGASVISWDYSMNEGNGAAVLESYLRHSQAQLRQPMVILLDTNRARCQLLEQYAKKGLLGDALCVGMANQAVEHLQDILARPEPDRPLGYQEWDQFGADASCPGRGSWHPKRQEHALIGWIMAMYFVSAVERAQAIIKSKPNWQTEYNHAASPLRVFPPPLAKPPDNDAAVTGLLYGHADGTQYVVNEVSCRTNFLPAIDGDKVLPSLVVDGLNRQVTADEIMAARSDGDYANGWVLDVSEVERDTKRKVERCGGLGYVDMKVALYGVPESGTLRLWLPAGETSRTVGGVASSVFRELVICEANEKRPKEACQLDGNLEVTVGGVVADGIQMIAGAGEYLKRRTCLHVGIPAAAQLTARSDVRDLAGKALSVLDLERLSPTANMGLVVDIKATGAVTRKNGACCLSHIVWETKDQI